MKRSPFVCPKCKQPKSYKAKQCITCSTKARVKRQKGHGTVSRYVNMGCRCDKCKRAWRDEQRKRRAKTPTEV